jgi:hypothetical protein
MPMFGISGWSDNEDEVFVVEATDEINATLQFMKWLDEQPEEVRMQAISWFVQQFDTKVH